MKGVHRFGVKGKLAPRYIGPFWIIQQCGLVAYQLELPPHLSSTHDVFHVSQLKKCLRVPIEAIKIETIQLEPDLTYQERPIKILDQKERLTRRRSVKSYKVQWSNHSEEEATWETEDFLRAHYPEFLPSHWRGDLHLFCKSNLQLASLNSQGSPKVNLWKTRVENNLKRRLSSPRMYS